MTFARLVVVLMMMRAAVAHAAPPDRSERLLGLARVWAEVKFFHPAMFQRVIDWDAALERAIPAVEAATTAAQYRDAIARMLATVGDPRTQLEAPDSGAPPAAWKTWADPQVLVLDARLPGDPLDFGALAALAHDASAELARARVAVIDLQGRDDDDDRLLDSVLDALPATRAWPTLRRIEHVGWRSQGDTNRDTYTTAWSTRSGGAPTAGGKTAHVVFAVDPRHALPAAAIALWLSGHATLVSPAGLDDSAATQSRRIELPWDVRVRVRTTDIVLPGGRGLAADVVTRPGEDVRARAIEVARAIARGSAPPRGAERRTAISNDLVLADDDDRPAAGLPGRERRMLAGIKAWAVIAYFHGTPRLDHDWDAQLRLTLPRLEAATTAEAYVAALGEMMLGAHDGHGYVRPRAEVNHRASTVIYWRRIEGKIVAGGLRDEVAGRATGIALGDELIRVDGVPAEQAAAAQLRITAGGNEESRAAWAVGFIDRGMRGTHVEIETRSRDGKLHEITLGRDYGYSENFYAHTGPVYRMLARDIGYADLSRLTGAEHDAMFAALGTARALVLDMRGYPRGGAWLLGQRLNTRNAGALAEIRTPVVRADTARQDHALRVLQQLSPSDKPVYRGKIVVLIDDRAVSAAEHQCLILEATSGATFIGSPTDGTNGEETYVRLPGGLEMRFTGMEILHADGRPLQQIGIQPHITVRPTLRGVRAGRDEVLERALRYLQTR